MRNSDFVLTRIKALEDRGALHKEDADVARAIIGEINKKMDLGSYTKYEADAIEEAWEHKMQAIAEINTQFSRKIDPVMIQCYQREILSRADTKEAVLGHLARLHEGVRRRLAFEKSMKDDFLASAKIEDQMKVQRAVAYIRASGLYKTPGKNMPYDKLVSAVAHCAGAVTGAVLSATTVKRGGWGFR